MKFIFILVALLAAHSARSQNCVLRFSGHVEDADTRDKLAAASISLKEIGRVLVTDEKGDFVFTGLCPGEYTLQVSHTNCETIERSIRLNKDFHLDIFLPHARAVLGEVVVEGQKGTSNTGFKKELSGIQLDQTRGQSLAEALSKINGITLLQTGSTISKPVLHGLHSNRILTINNGVRQEGQQWGNEHAPEIDPFIADKLTVIKGVDELRYGSDAIGGVILVEPKPLSDHPGHSGEINTAWFSNNRQYVVSGVYERRSKKIPAFGYRIQGTFRKGANAATPGYRLNNTGSEEKNFSLTAGWKKKGFHSELFYSQFATKLGIFTGSHIGNLTDLLHAINEPRPNDVFLGQDTYDIGRPYQDVRHHLLKLKSSIYRGGHKFNFLVSGQFNHRREYDIVRSSSNTNPQLDLSIYTLAEDISWEHPRKSNFSGIVGLSFMQQDNSYGGRYFIPNYSGYTFGGYVIEKWSRHLWELQAGIRYDHKNIGTTRLKFNGDTINHDFHFSTLGSSFNAIYKPSEKWKLNTSLSLASRAPFVNELLSDGIHHGTATYEKGDITLKPERSANLSVGINFNNHAGSVAVDILAYSNHIRDFIYQQPMPDSPVLTIAGAFPLLAYKQTDAVLNGFDISAFFKPAPRVGWVSKLSVLFARNIKQDDWLILMPANRISNELTWNFKDGKKLADSYFSLEMTNVMRQTRTPDEGNQKQDYKVPPPGYTLLNLNTSTTIPVFRLPVVFSAGVRNLMNVRYRDYLNAMRYYTDEMGRNISVRIKVPINQAHH